MKANPRGPREKSFHFIGLGNGVWGFKNTIGERTFLKLENVLSPGGSLRKQLPRGPIVFNLCFIGVGNGTGGFENIILQLPF